MLESLLRCGPFRNIDANQTPHKVFCFRRDLHVVREFKLSFLHTVDHVHVTVAIERVLTAQQRIAYHPHSPHVALEAIPNPSVLCPDHLRRSVMRGAAGRNELLVLLQDLGKAEVDHLYQRKDSLLVIFHQQHVLQLEISVNNLSVVEVLYCRKHLIHNVHNTAFSELDNFPVWRDPISHSISFKLNTLEETEELPPKTSFCHHPTTVGGFMNSDKLHDVWVINLLQNRNFSLQSLHKDRVVMRDSYNLHG
mmetsp:Transcript_21412/g.48459  ORF Transcript_21412/g.48459 Transcript_21412/m.48459 type:complete len:251 (-) Transcript_21412:633-1385(-)